MSLLFTIKFFHQPSFVFLCLCEESLVFFRIRIEGTVAQGCLYRLPLLQKLVRIVGEERVGEALPDVLHGLVGWMEHVFTIKAIVA